MGAAPAATQRLAVMAPSFELLAHRYSTLLREVTARQHIVLCLAPQSDIEGQHVLTDLGAQTALFDPEPSGYFAARKAVQGVARILTEWQAGMMLGISDTTMALAAAGANASQVARIVSVCDGAPLGGFAADRHGTLSAHGYARAFDDSDAVVFHNHDDARAAASLHLVPADLQVHVVPGAGVNLVGFTPQDLPSAGAGLVFLMISALELRRGVADYIAAARETKARTPNSRFLLAGPAGKGRDAVHPASGQGAVEYLGAVADPRTLLAQCHVYVYPSHAEGIPQSILEAMASARPILTSDTPGCRETVDERVNGCLVSAGDAAGLALALESFVKRPDLLPSQARASRHKAERLFDERDVNRRMLAILGLD